MMTTHNPGGKVRHAVRPDARSDADFSACGRYRHRLIRNWANGSQWRVIVWIGMNPSTADEQWNDPTCHRECVITARLGGNVYYKLNVMDYRITDPKWLLLPEVAPRSDDNLSFIRTGALEADLIIAVWGKLPKRLQRYADDTAALLRSIGKPVFCLKKNKDGSPGHPLYLPLNSQPIPWP